MKKLLTILLLFASLTASADKWYIATAANGGSDTDGDGSITEPWLTLKHACDTITGAAFIGDTISVGAGTFDETVQVTRSPDVHIMGQVASPLTSIITSSNALSPIILLASATEGTDGNQSISYIKFDGNLTALSAIYITGRSNVSIHHCTFIDLESEGVIFRGKISGLGEPTVYATGNSFNNNTMTNCAKYLTWARGCLSLAGQADMDILDNIIVQTARAGGSNGYPIKASYPNEGHNYGIEIAGNYLEADAYSDGIYGIAIEFWNSHGGMIVRDNTISGSVDWGGLVTEDKYAYGFAASVHHNYIGRSTLQPSGELGIIIESDLNGGMDIYSNYLKNLYTGIGINTYHLNDTIADLSIHHNIFSGLGVSGSTNGKGIDIHGASVGVVARLDIFNNIFDENNVGTSTFGIDFRPAGNMMDIRIRNNIITNFGVAVYMAAAVTITDMSFENNNLYGNENNATNYVGITFVNKTEQNNITTDPLFRSASDLHLQSTSPCIDAGLDVSATTGGLDFHGASLYGATYDIGAFEYGLNRLMRINDTILPTINYKVVLIDH